MSLFIYLFIYLLSFYYFGSFSHQRKLMVFHWSLSNSKSPRVSRTFLSILADLNNPVVWMVSTLLISWSSNLFINPLVTVPSAPIIIGITVIFMFYSFFSILLQSLGPYFSLGFFRFYPVVHRNDKVSYSEGSLFLCGLSHCWMLAFSTTSCLQTLRSPNWLNFLCTELYNSSTPTQYLPITGHLNMHFRRLSNGMFDRHRAEITVMQFTGHSLPVHQFATVPWDFNPVPYCQPSSPTPMEYALLPSLEWHVWRGRRSIYNKVSKLDLRSKRKLFRMSTANPKFTDRQVRDKNAITATVSVDNVRRDARLIG